MDICFTSYIVEGNHETLQLRNLIYILVQRITFIVDGQNQPLVLTSHEQVQRLLSGASFSLRD